MPFYEAVGWAFEDKLMGRRILRHTYRSRGLAIVVNVARGERSEEDVLEEVEMLREEGPRGHIG